jgi:hypothetical protein
MTDQAKKPNLLKQIPLTILGVVAAVSTYGGLMDIFPKSITAPTAPQISQNCVMACPARASLDLGIVAGAQAGANMYNETIKAFERPTPRGWWKPPTEFNNAFPNHTTASKVAIDLGLTMIWGAIGLSVLRSSGQSKSSNKGGEPENPPNFPDRGSR